MVIKLLILGGYGQFVWSAYIFTCVSCLYLYFKTKAELKKQEKMFFNKFKQLHTVKIEAAKRKEAESGDTIQNEGARGKPVGRITHRDGTTTPVYRDEEKDVRARFAEHKKNPGKRSFKKSDVEHGTYGNAAQSPDAGVSTDTDIDVSESTGYEERPHISVEEAGKLPRATFQTGNETNVRGGSESKEPHKTTRKKGIPEQHPNTYGMRYGMKGGVKKVWCPEHQIWEETTKDWHE